MAGQRAIKATTRTRQVPVEQVPAELLNMYKDDVAPEVANASLAFTTVATGDEPEEERDELFSVDGKVYTIPVEFGPGIGLIYLDRIGEGRDVALGGILKAVIGEDGWAALLMLAAKNRINADQFKALVQKVQDRTMGAVEKMEGNS